MILLDNCRKSVNDLHVNRNGKMVIFAGFYLPIQYEDASISASHLHIACTRSNCSIFDVSHTLQSYVRGKHAVEFIESLCVIRYMKPGRSALSLYINDANGGIIDDLIVTKISDDTLYIVYRMLPDNPSAKNTISSKMFIFLSTRISLPRAPRS
ncbi:aminomethyltransferase, mitochondrial-like [Planococcus citri]|uniref:aminomethyltransferase, mitochondrial-like n=1 Tax=Planococcus citri TaxID=170843 RepID=UPI0031F87BA7